jgi:hypothetical protein
MNKGYGSEMSDNNFNFGVRKPKLIAFTCDWIKR